MSNAGQCSMCTNPLSTRSLTKIRNTECRCVVCALYLTDDRSSPTVSSSYYPGRPRRSRGNFYMDINLRELICARVFIEERRLAGEVNSINHCAMLCYSSGAAPGADAFFLLRSQPNLYTKQKSSQIIICLPDGKFKSFVPHRCINFFTHIICWHLCHVHQRV